MELARQEHPFEAPAKEREIASMQRIFEEEILQMNNDLQKQMNKVYVKCCQQYFYYLIPTDQEN